MRWEQDGYAHPTPSEWEAERWRDSEDRRLEEGTPSPDWNVPEPIPPHTPTQDKNAVDEAGDEDNHRS